MKKETFEKQRRFPFFSAFLKNEKAQNTLEVA